MTSNECVAGFGYSVQFEDLGCRCRIELRVIKGIGDGFTVWKHDGSSGQFEGRVPGNVNE